LNRRLPKSSAITIRLFANYQQKKEKTVGAKAGTVVVLLIIVCVLPKRITTLGDTTHYRHYKLLNLGRFAEPQGLEAGGFKQGTVGWEAETCTLLAMLLAACSGGQTGPPNVNPHGQSVTVTQSVANQVDISWTGLANANSYQVEVDDNPKFLQPMVSQIISNVSISLNVFDAGFAPGVTYFVKIHPSGAQTTFQLNVQPWQDSFLTYSYARAAWENIGRQWLSSHSGINWNNSAKSWDFDNSWPQAETDVAQQAYYIEWAARAALQMGSVRDAALLDELAAFYVAYEGRFTTLGAMRALTQYDRSLLANGGPDSIKTLVWVWDDGTITYVRECDLCNSQFFHPVARLIRIIATLPLAKRTPAMQNFVSWYAPVVTHDHLLRLLWGSNGDVIHNIQNTPNYISDRDLWLIAAAAEMLGANSDDPDLVPLSTNDKSQLQQAVQITTKVLQAQYRTFYPDIQNFQGTVVGGVSYFNGEWTNLPSYAYSGYDGQAFPVPSDARIQPNASWDISHFYRVPIFFRALYDNKKAIAVSYPSITEVQLLINQLMYRTFQGNLNLPLFNNYFDGSNGWFEVGFHGPNFGYPPAQYCNMLLTLPFDEHCLNAGAVQGWGLIAFFSPDLTNLEHSLATLAWSQDANQIVFRSRYYDSGGGDNYTAVDAQNNVHYPSNLLWVLSEISEKLQ
jgi:hypothetical protein